MKRIIVLAVLFLLACVAVAVADRIRDRPETEQIVEPITDIDYEGAIFN